MTQIQGDLTIGGGVLLEQGTHQEPGSRWRAAGYNVSCDTMWLRKTERRRFLICFGETNRGRRKRERASGQTIRLHRANLPHKYIRLPDHPSTLLPRSSLHSTTPNCPTDVQQHDRMRLTMVACPLLCPLPCRRWVLEVWQYRRLDADQKGQYTDRSDGAPAK